MPQEPEQPKPRDPAKRPQPEPPGIGRPMRRGDDKEQPDERPPERPVRREEQQPETD